MSLRNSAESFARLYDEGPHPRTDLIVSRFTGWALRHHTTLKALLWVVLIIATVSAFIAWGRFLDSVRFA